MPRLGETAVLYFDEASSTPDQPHAIITADCSSPKEIDDGIFVKRLDAATELYRVGVCVADTSKLYDDGTTFKNALRKTEAKYFYNQDGSKGHDPMIDPGLIRELEFKAGTTRSSLIISFDVGANHPPSDLNIAFGRVEVKQNLNYNKFGQECRYSTRKSRFGRASAFILQHLQYHSGGDEDGTLVEASTSLEETYGNLIHVPSSRGWARGARINEAFMIGANYLVGELLSKEGRPAVYRVHDINDESLIEVFPPNIAIYSRNPGPHDGLNLPVYCRTTSPLRRLEDFVMSYQLRQRYEGRSVTSRDVRDVGAAVQQLNRRIAGELLEGSLRLGRRDVLGSGPLSLGQIACEDAKVVAIHPDGQAAAS